MTRVVAAVVVRGERVLIARRFEGADQGGLWEFPGGKVEAGESDEAALARELREELDIGVEVGPLLLRLAHSYPGRDPIELSFFACRPLGGDPRPIGCTALRWVATGELGQYAFPAADAPAVARLQSPGGLERLFEEPDGVPLGQAPRAGGPASAAPGRRRRPGGRR